MNNGIETMTVTSTSIGSAIANFKYWRIPFKFIHNMSPIRWDDISAVISIIGCTAEIEMAIGTYGSNPASTINKYVLRVVELLISMLRGSEMMGISTDRIDSARGILSNWLTRVGGTLIADNDEHFMGYTLRMVLHDSQGRIYSFNTYIPIGARRS